MRRLVFGIAAVVVIVAICLIAFSKLRPSAPLDQTTARDSNAVVLPDNYQPQPTKANRRYKLGVLFPFLGAPFWVNEAYGVLDQGKLNGVDIVWLSADGYDNIQKQNSQIEDLVTLKVDAILLAATSFNGTARAVDNAIAAKIPVLTHVTSSNTSGIAAAVLTDDLAIGRKQAEYMCKALGNAGTVAMLNGPAAAEWSSNRAKGFKAGISSGCSGVQIAAERFGIPDRNDARRLAEDLLVTFPNLAGIFTVADGMALGASDAVAAIGRTGRITITTASFSRETVPSLQSGAIAVNVDESPVVIGRVVVNRATELLNGKDVPKTTFVPIPAWTKENIGSVPNDHWAPADWRIH